MKRRLIKLPGAPEAWIDPKTVICARIEVGHDEPFVVVHTSEGFAVGLSPLHQTVEDLLDDVMTALRKGR